MKIQTPLATGKWEEKKKRRLQWKFHSFCSEVCRWWKFAYFRKGKICLACGWYLQFRSFWIKFWKRATGIQLKGIIESQYSVTISVTFPGENEACNELSRVGQSAAPERGSWKFIHCRLFSTTIDEKGHMFHCILKDHTTLKTSQVSSMSKNGVVWV